LLPAAAVLGVLLGASAQVQPDSRPRSIYTNVIQPTVTAKMGDVGGKFFGQTPDPARTHRYFIAAEPVLWDYAPDGRDLICGKPFPPSLATQRQSGKTRYVQYTDETFTAKVRQEPSLGIMGPVLRGKVGEFLAITFINRTADPLSMHPHGVKYDKDSEGSYYQPKPGAGAAVGPNAKFTYVWQLDEESGPLPTEPSSKGWLYHSHVTGDEEVQRGLMGCIIVTDPQRARADGTPKDVDRELATLYMIFDESGLGAEEKEAAEYASLPGGGPPRKSWAQVQEMMEAGSRYTINGLTYGNLPGLEVNEGEHVRWYLFALGSEQDVHTAHWHGLRVIEDGRRRTDVVELFPASAKIADMRADNPGTWLMHCHVAEHMQEGMFARVIVHPKSAPKSGGGFFGVGASQRSLQITRAEAKVFPAGDKFELKLEGAVTVFDAFSVFMTPVTFRIGEKNFTFTLGRKGEATNADGSFQVKNASEFGVIYGGVMEFEATLAGEEAKKLGLDSAATLPITMHVRSAQHSAEVHLAISK
jgi:FtsP/CotA-like multicopper oxidase with cupredoxin domain